VLPVLRVILAGVFALAGATKLLDRRGSRQSLQDFGVPTRLIPALAVALPVVELVTALALLPQATAIYGAIGAAALLCAFIGAVSVSLLRGRRPDCHCFGQLHSEPIGWQVLARNGALLFAALFVIVQGWPTGGAGAGDWLLSLTPVWRTVVAGLIIGIAAYTFRATRQAQAPRDAPLVPDWHSSGIPIGQPAPEFSLPDLDGTFVTLSMLRAPGKPVLLVFIDPHCNPCMALLPDIAQWQRELTALVTVAVISRGTPEANRAKLAGHTIDRVLLQKDREVTKALGVPFTPGAVLVRADGTMGNLPAPGDKAVRQMMAGLAASGGKWRFDVGSPAPDFSLPDLAERVVDLAQLRGRATVLLFWDPGCTYCQQLLGHIRFWEARQLADRPQLLVVSAGDASANAGLGFNSPVVLDHGFATGSRYGVAGTPAAGGAAILDLIGQRDLSSLSSETTVARTADDGAASWITLPPGARPRQQDCVHDEMLADGNMVLYNGCRQQVMTLNATAALVWEYCDGEHDVEAIVSEIAGVFPSAPRPDADVRAMLDSFLQTGLIVAGPAGAGPAGPRAAH